MTTSKNQTDEDGTVDIDPKIGQLVNKNFKSLLWTEELPDTNVAKSVPTTQHTDTTSNEAKTLKELGWSEDNIALAIGVSRPTLKRFLDGKSDTLGEVADMRLYILANRVATGYKTFVNQAIHDALEKQVWIPAYAELGNRL